MRLHAVVIAGGAGTRFWPVSRAHRPKQLLPLGSDQSLLAQTFDRVGSLVPKERQWMAVGQAHAQACRDAAPQVPAIQVIAEPASRNTAPAIGLAAMHLQQADPQGLMAVLPADHHVRDKAAFCTALEKAQELAEQDYIVTLGITPTR